MRDVAVLEVRLGFCSPRRGALEVQEYEEKSEMEEVRSSENCDEEEEEEEEVASERTEAGAGGATSDEVCSTWRRTEDI